MYVDEHAVFVKSYFSKLLLGKVYVYAHKEYKIPELLFLIF